MAWAETYKRSQELMRQLERLPALGAAAIALGAAQRLMDGYIPRTEKRDEDKFVLGWSSALQLMWKAISTANPTGDREIQSRLSEYRQAHTATMQRTRVASTRMSTPPYALEAYCRSSPAIASAAVWRLLDAPEALIDERDDPDEGDGLRPQTDQDLEKWASAMDVELDLLEMALGIIAREGVSLSSVTRMRRAMQLEDDPSVLALEER
jgi:hypothetical protein